MASRALMTDDGGLILEDSIFAPASKSLLSRWPSGRCGRHAASLGTRSKTASSSPHRNPGNEEPAGLVGGRGLGRGAHRTFRSVAAASPIPVLLPFDTAAFLKDKTANKGAVPDRGKYFSGFTASNVFFFPGPAGYDASILLQPQDSGSLQFGKAVDAQISASSVIYAPSPNWRPSFQVSGA